MVAASDLLSADDVCCSLAEETSVGESNQFDGIFEHLTLAANIVCPAKALKSGIASTHTYIHTYVRTCRLMYSMHIYTSSYNHSTQTHRQTQARTHPHTSACTHAHTTHTHTHTQHTCTHTLTHTHTHTHTHNTQHTQHTHTHAHTHTHTHTHMHAGTYVLMD